MCVCLAQPTLIEFDSGVDPVMEMTGSERIAAPRERVYAALNDPEVLKAAIPGCESLEKTSDSEMTATVVTKVGPVKAKFQGAVTLSDFDPPNGYSIRGEGKGGAAGFAKGGARVRLEEDGPDGGATVLHYEVKADVGGKLAQLGSLLIDSTAKKLAGEFFLRFGQQVAGQVAGQAAVPTAASRAEAAVSPAATESPGAAMRGATGGTLWLWGLGAMVAVLATAILLAR
jgi:carbon monoxide dehydrogenase subunit G